MQRHVDGNQRAWATCGFTGKTVKPVWPRSVAHLTNSNPCKKRFSNRPIRFPGSNLDSGEITGNVIGSARSKDLAAWARGLSPTNTTLSDAPHRLASEKTSGIQGTRYFEVILKFVSHCQNYLEIEVLHGSLVAWQEQWKYFAQERNFSSTGKKIGHFRVFVSLFQSEFKCETIVMKMTLICMRMKLHAELIFIWKVSHLDPFWNRGTREHCRNVRGLERVYYID